MEVGTYRYLDLAPNSALACLDPSAEIMKASGHELFESRRPRRICIDIELAEALIMRISLLLSSRALAGCLPIEAAGLPGLI